ncbi:hypothetical protein Nepgr_027075 [Nepenthes gracilis]|uniref:Cyclin-dependent kinase inhibitor domain-containing protein n=1 Tax=Nepenthes gracilis TaxID=150966 RepID=A0AAD3TB40_NEPGR|nr:hypothetical protein Nepgr_027075 [Nepenthes gracilis]
MRRYPRKCKRVVSKNSVVGVAEIGGRVRTRARALAVAAAAAAAAASSSGSTAGKGIRKVGSGERRLASMHAELRSRRRTVIATKASVIYAKETNCSSGTSGRMSASCCSSNASSELVKDPFAVVGPEEESGEDEMTMHSHCKERRETKASSEFRESEDLESIARLPEANSHLRSAVHKMPSQLEIEEFFAAAEKDLKKSFIEKYNFDIVEDVPLEGRYQWDPTKP